jgi:hypothetical protein
MPKADKRINKPAMLSTLVIRTDLAVRDGLFSFLVLNITMGPPSCTT